MLAMDYDNDHAGGSHTMSAVKEEGVRVIGLGLARRAVGGAAEAWTPGKGARLMMSHLC